MLANGIKQTSSTAGTGALTVATVVGSVPLSLAFALGQPFAYSIWSGTADAPVFREAGIGYLSASNTMVRARVSATFDGTSSYNQINPTATDFAGTAVTIICTPHAATLESIPATIDTVSASIARLISSAARTMTTSATLLNAGDTSYVPFLLKNGAPVSSLAVYVSTAGATGSFLRAGLYPCNEKGYIGGQIATTGNLDAGSTGLKSGTLAAPIFLPPGWYVTAVTTNAASGVTITAYTSAAQNALGCTPFGWSSAFTPPLPVDFRIESGGANSVLPVTPSATTAVKVFGQVHTPLIWLGV